METRVKEILVFVGFLFLVIIAGTLFRNIAPKLTGEVVFDSELNQSQEKAEILSHEMAVNPNGYLAVSGIVENKVDSELNYVEVKVKFYNNEGNVLETTSESIFNLEKGERWKFESVYPKFDISKVSKYEVKLGEVW